MGTNKSPSNLKEALAELEEKMFGIHRPFVQDQIITDRDFIPIKSGIAGNKFLKNGPKFIFDAREHEPLYPPQDNIVEECLRRESERIANQENLINRIVYDSIDKDINSIGEIDVKDCPDAMNDC
jgi:hypothetical protein